MDCACKSPDAKECIQRRYPQKYRDFDLYGQALEEQEYRCMQDRCECPCHHQEEEFIEP